MAGTYGIDVQSFHAEHVLQHLLLADGTTRLLAEVVAVHSVEDYPFAIDKQGAVISDADGTEAYLTAAQVYHLLATHQRQREVVELGILGTPSLYVRDAYTLRTAGCCQCLGVLLQLVGPVTDGSHKGQTIDVLRGNIVLNLC